MPNSNIDKAIKKYALQDRVIITGYFAGSLEVLYKGAELYVQAAYYEGFGIPVLEALNSGVPVITSRGGCLAETAGKGGLLIEPNDREEMIDAIRQVLEKSAFRDRLIREGGAHALKFREEQTIPSLYNVYLECMHD